jgi:purine-binding chemotaxis protein CheW
MDTSGNKKPEKPSRSLREALSIRNLRSTEMADTVVSNQYLTFGLADEIFGIEVRAIQEILELQRITKIPRAQEYLLGVMNVRGRVVPVVDLRLKFGLPAAEPTVESAIVVVELAESGVDSLIGVLVDRVQEVLELSEEDLQPAPRVGTSVSAQVLSGMGKKDDTFILLLRVENIFSAEDVEVARDTAAMQAESEELVTADE